MSGGGPGQADGRIPAGEDEVPEAARARWCVIRAPGLRGARVLWPFLSFVDAAGREVGTQDFLGPARLGRGYRTLAFVPAAAVSCRVATMYPTAADSRASLSFKPLGRFGAALGIMATDLGSLPGMLRLVASRQVRRARTVMISVAARMNRPRLYPTWLECFDQWPVAPPAGTEGRATLSALVLAREDGPALAATLAGIEAQGAPVDHAVLLGSAAGWRQEAAGLQGEYVALLQAGEVLPPHASWLAGAELRRLGDPPLAYADEDRLDEDGTRHDPVFRPQPSRTLMLSGTLTRGTWFVRRDVLLAHPDGDDPGWAECLRLDIWLRRHEAGAEPGERLPLLLTRRRPDAEQAPAEALAALANAHLVRSAMPLRVEPRFPLLLRRDGATNAGLVSVVVPSTLRTPLIARCLLSVLRDTADAEFELLVGVSQPGPLDAVQRAAASRIEADPRARVLHLPFESFNFSRVCNALAAEGSGDAILLLNDDVSVLEPGWLAEMTAHLADPAVGIVGAKLLYPDMTVQHGGVLMGLAGLCDHVNRHLPRAAPGYADRAAVAQELSAVTAACLLVRRTVFDAVGGLDEDYPSAFNDVDFCLRVREAGHAVVLAPAAELVHHEMQTYGSHYSGDRAPFEAAEIARMRRRWAGVVAADPFHSPNLDLVPGQEWQLAFPPRRPRGVVPTA